MSFSDTRLPSRKQAIDAGMQSAPAILDALKRIIDNLCQPRPKLPIFEFEFSLVFWRAHLEKTFILTLYLQQESMDVSTAFSSHGAAYSTDQRFALRREEASIDTENAAMELAIL